MKLSMIDRNLDLSMWQNTGTTDRLVRVTIGSLCIVTAIFFIFKSDAVPTWIHDKETMASWMYYLMLVAIYPLITGVLGKDPIYMLFSLDTSSTPTKDIDGQIHDNSRYEKR